MGTGVSGLYYGVKMSVVPVAGESVFKSKDENNKYTYFKYISKRTDIDKNGVYDVVAHGRANAVQIEHNGKNLDVNSRVMARLVKSSKNYGEKQPIRLLSCNTGSISNGFAQNLANKLNVVVYAPTNLVWAYPNGTHIVAPRKSNNPNNPDYHHPDLSKRGKFIPFYPGGNKK